MPQAAGTAPAQHTHSVLEAWEGDTGGSRVGEDHGGDRDSITGGVGTSQRALQLTLAFTECNSRWTQMCLDCTIAPCSQRSAPLIRVISAAIPLRRSAVLTSDFPWGPLLWNRSENQTHNEVGGCHLWEVGHGDILLIKISP